MPRRNSGGGWFFAVYAVGVADRQNALFWLVFPIIECLRRWSRPSDWSGDSRRLAWGVVAAPAWFAVLALGMNRTAGQAALTFHPFGTLQRRPFLQTGMAAVTVGTMAIGLAAFRQRVVRGRWSLVSIRSHPYGWAVGVMAVGLVFVVDQPPRIALRA